MWPRSRSLKRLSYYTHRSSVLDDERPGRDLTALHRVTQNACGFSIMNVYCLEFPISFFLDRGQPAVQ